MNEQNPIEQEEHVLGERLNGEPLMFRGCTSSELSVLLGVSVAVWIPLSIIIALILGKILYAMGIILAGVLVTVFVVATKLQKVKLNRPDNYYQHLLWRWLHKTGIHTSYGVVWRSGSWDVDRTQ